MSKARQGMVSAANKGVNFYLQRVDAKAPEGFKLADRGQCEDCDRAWFTLDEGVKRYVPKVGFAEVMVKQTVLTQLTGPLGLANLWKDHCEGCKKNHLEGLLEQPKPPSE